MADRIRFHLDENVNGQVARALRQHGCNVTTSQDVQLRTASDTQQLAFAHASGRVLVTHDADLLRLANAGIPHAGIAYCTLQSRTVGEVVRGLILVYAVLTPDEMAGHIEFL